MRTQQVLSKPKRTIVLDNDIAFTFRNQLCHAVVFFRFEEVPPLIFVLFSDPDLIREFGEELIIYTDCKIVRFWEDDPTQLTALKQIIFQAVKHTDSFLHAKRKANC